MKQLLTIKEVSVQINRCYHTVLKMVHEKTLPAIQFAGSREYLVDPADLDALISGSKSGTDAILDDSKSLQMVALEKRSREPKSRSRKGGNLNWQKEFDRGRSR